MKMKYKFNPLRLDTFGNTPACIKLVEIINENEFQNASKIGKFLTKYNSILNELYKIDYKIRITLAKDIHDKFSNKCLKFELPYQTYIKNILNTKYKVIVKN